MGDSGDGQKVVEAAWGSRAERAEAARLERARRHRLAQQLAEPHDGVVTRAMLLGEGLTRGQIDVELRHGAWIAWGRHTIGVTSEPGSRAPWWAALWESGRRSVLDGVTALQAAGLSGWNEPLVHVTVPNDAHVRDRSGVRHHFLRQRGECIDTGLRRTKPHVAAIRAAQWARSDRQAATLLAMTVQQRLVSKERLLEHWDSVGYSARRQVLHDVVRDVCAGAESLGELDFAVVCRRRSLPEPTRQAVRLGERGTVYLDVEWEELGVRGEIHGFQHYSGTAVIDDALRQNDVGLAQPGTVSLQIPVLGLRTCPDRFMAQVERALNEARARRAAG
ncbi:hypothetical protein [Ornithinimicrobium tianjinense]|uniref:Transcriptional regulator, AbiEi antitoxin, Type IV TA system n=1 Tax=Ornithinimicrobium tianjinense TaxID=1195761 RepID=A0A917BUF3_9MICO|nr:hypothetical protein [Ornithinimicrobium tianjinense]GGF57211.1 hypothetical protein GCM10011366_26350 [Ornithinimicrobium tianjinense]